MGRKKKVKQHLQPTNDKKPKVLDQNKPENISVKNFCWKVDPNIIDKCGRWGWKKAKYEDLFDDIIITLQNCEGRTWADVEGKSNHFISVERICKQAQKRLIELDLEDNEDLFSLRINGKKRLWGIRRGSQLLLLWWDPEHEICPSNKKHT